MYKQIKQYVVLAGNGIKMADAGLLKIRFTDEKIRIEYFLNTLPVLYGTQMECVLRLRKKGEVASTKIWKDTLEKGNSHYVFSLDHPGNIQEIVDCRLILQGNRMVVSDEKLTMHEASMQESVPTSEKPEMQMQGQTKSRTETEEDRLRNIEYIRDLEYLKSGNDQMAELYYNSFLLHGFYQYRYFIVGKDFIGVPDHFYEREAIAARMMGFPYFMEAEFVENCDLNGEMREGLPKHGSFGYYLKKITK
ncbi:MAG: hypothetical protein IJ429_02605 [Lachnospiraceae bacterium]|nr:hypothetical protein [Lachnospiraceae bacterium]